MSEPLLEVKNLKVHFPVHGGVFLRRVATVKAVDGISFSVYPGETLGLVGESGCGKSTTGRAIINLLRYMSRGVEISGKILYNGRDLVPLSNSKMRPLRKDIQMIFQDPFSSLNPRMTVMKTISDPMRIHLDYSKQERREQVLELMDKVGLNSDQADRYPHEFSGGQRQRISIARSLATKPKLIIADEPVSALDVSVQAQVINLMQDLQEEFNLTYVFIAHDLSVVYHISTRIAVMYLGNIVEIGLADDVYNNPQHPYTKALISAVPVPDPTVKNLDRIRLEGDVPSPMAKPSGCGFRTRCPIARPACADNVPELTADPATPERFIACPYYK